MSNNKIKCPNCGTLIDVDDALSHQAEEKYKKEFEEKQRNSNAEILKQKEILALQQREFEEKKAKENTAKTGAVDKYVKKNFIKKLKVERLPSLWGQGTSFK